MSCNNPLLAYQPLGGGKLIFGKEPANSREINVPCGQCRGCKQRRSQEWATRCVHEAQTHAENCFITLTYGDKNLPPYGSLHKPHLQEFLKRLRYHKGPFRFYACGEYGDVTNRAHYHACIFGIDFQDKIEFRRINEHTLYVSQQLQRIWGHGHTSVSSLTHETASYTASYVHKKLKNGQQKYVRIDETTGEIIPLVQPFATMSLKPAIAKEWLLKYHGDIYNADKDYIVIKGAKRRPSRFYDKIYDTINPSHMDHIKQNRLLNAIPLSENEYRAREKNARARLISRKQV